MTIPTFPVNDSQEVLHVKPPVKRQVVFDGFSYTIVPTVVSMPEKLEPGQKEVEIDNVLYVLTPAASNEKP